MVLWYKKDDKTPIYSYDSRTGSPDLWSEPSVFGERAVFRDYGGAQPAALAISEVTKENDEGGNQWDYYDTLEQTRNYQLSSIYLTGENFPIQK